MMRRLMSKLFGKKEETVEKAMTKQAAQITKALAQLDALAAKGGRN